MKGVLENSLRTPDAGMGWNYGDKKSVRAVLLPVPLVEAFALPISVERANMQRPHAEYEI